MLSLKDAINESLNHNYSMYEAASDVDDATRDEILKFIEDNYRVIAIGELIFRKKNNMIYVDFMNGHEMTAHKDIKQLTNGMFMWGNVDCVFDCSDCKNLTSLEGAPEECRVFNCDYCSNLKDLMGIGKCREVSCENCDRLKSLKGLNLKNKSCEEIRCNDCRSLISLEGSPKKCERFECNDCKNLTTLKGGPEVVEFFTIENCIKLKSWDGAPRKVSDNLFYGGCEYLKNQTPPCKFVNGAEAIY